MTNTLDPTAHIDGGLGVLAGRVPLLLGQLEQLLEALLHLPVAAAHQRQLLELPHLGHPAAVCAKTPSERPSCTDMQQSYQVEILASFQQDMSHDHRLLQEVFKNKDVCSSHSGGDSARPHWCRSGGRRRSISDSDAAAASSLSFLTVSLPMWLSLEMGSSSDGISCFFRFFVRLVTTCADQYISSGQGTGVGRSCFRHVRPPGCASLMF
jgi:hypothetical protein